MSQLSQVGHGGFSTVFRGYQERFDRWVAVKVLDLDSMDSVSLRRFERECAAMGRLSNHPHVVTIYDSGVLEDGRPYLVSEYCDGGSLAEQLAGSGPLPVNQVLGIGHRVASALQEGHRVGIIHRDVKPANILIRSFGEPGLADFGMSLRTDGNASRGLDAFSPEHAAPESLAVGEYTAASDIYSLGSTLYTLATGRPPFQFREGEGPLPYFHRVLFDPVPPIQRTDVPAEVRELLLSASARDPTARPSGELVHDHLYALRGSVATVALSPGGPVRRPETFLPVGTLDAVVGGGRASTGPAAEEEPGTRLRSSMVDAGQASRSHRRHRLVAAVSAVVAAAIPLSVLSLLVVPKMGSRRQTTVSPGASPPPQPPSVSSSARLSSSLAAPKTTPLTRSSTPAAGDGRRTPAGYRSVRGPQGVTVAIPSGWRVHAGPSASNRQADDPDEAGSSGRFVRFAGERAGAKPLAATVARIEQGFRSPTDIDDYTGLRRQASHHGSGAAVDWEFVLTRDRQTRHAYGRYWRLRGVDYAVYASAPADEWTGMRPILRVLLQTAGPR